MAEREFIFRQSSKELILPVTPSSYRVETGVNVEIVNIHELGDVPLTGYGILATIKIDCMLPDNDYSFARDDDPNPYIKQFEKWVKQKRRLRFIVGDTRVNVPVIVENFSYGESDGTNDVYATITLREHRAPAPVQVAAPPTENKPREGSEGGSDPSVQNYTIVYGDTLSGICRKFYGDGSAATYNKLAAYNGIANPHLIYAGNVLRIPKPLT